MERCVQEECKRKQKHSGCVASPKNLASVPNVSQSNGLLLHLPKKVTKSFMMLVGDVTVT